MSDCFEWHMTRNNKGYGVMTRGGKKFLAHRVSAEMCIGPIDGKVVMHTCDNPACVNPNHLVIGTQKDNMQDALKKGRMKIPDAKVYIKNRMRDKRGRFM